MEYKTVFCPTIELERTGMPSRGVETALRLTLTPSIDDYGEKLRPTVIEANIIGISTPNDGIVVYDGVVGKQGDLLITHHDSNVDAVMMNDRGELIIATVDDDPNSYSRSTEGGDNVLGKYLMYLDANALL